jgi:hypothetical protein
MPLDINKSYSDINNKIESFNTFRKSKSDVKNRLQQQTNFDVSSLSSAAKGEIKNQLDNLINTFTNTNSSGSATITYLLGKFVRSVKLLRPQIKEIIVSCMIKSLGCDLEQTYDGGQVIYIKVSSIDIFNILKKDPNSDKYALAMYEKQQFTNSYQNFEYMVAHQISLKILPLGTKNKTTDEIKQYCTECGTKTKSKYKFCPSCGNKL